MHANLVGAPGLDVTSAARTRRPFLEPLGQANFALLTSVMGACRQGRPPWWCARGLTIRLQVLVRQRVNHLLVRGRAPITQRQWFAHLAFAELVSGVRDGRALRS